MKITFVESVFEGMNDEFKNPTLPDGAAQWSRNEEGVLQGLIYICPCGCKEVSSVPVAPALQGWGFNGHLEQPTLTPSIFKKGGCKWHGYLTDGEWRQV
ncbi:MAG: hypothetical protein HOP33_09010 [Verrucomicrobia bacterium]|nr:hypothetical protein [Verrucomicrobiota bacterium]